MSVPPPPPPDATEATHATDGTAGAEGGAGGCHRSKEPDVDGDDDCAVLAPAGPSTPTTHPPLSYLEVPWAKVDWDDVLDGHTRVNHYFMRSGLVRKDLLSRFAVGMLPPTLLVRTFRDVEAALKEGRAAAEADVARLVAVIGAASPEGAETSDAAPEAATTQRPPAGAAGAAEGDARADEPDCWVLKLPASSNGHGMRFIRNPWAHGDPDDADSRGVPASLRGLYNELETFDEAAPRSKRLVLQLYVRPALLRGRKFHIRSLVLAVGALDVYLHRRSRVLVATEPFSYSDLTNSYVHITNRSYNIRHKDYDAGLQNVGMEALDGAEVSPAGVSSASVLRQMKHLTAELFRRLGKSRRYFFTHPRCFEVFGFDWLVDANGRVLLLEANADPSLSMYGVAAFSELVADPWQQRHARHEDWDEVLRGPDPAADSVET